MLDKVGEGAKNNKRKVIKGNEKRWGRERIAIMVICTWKIRGK